MFFPCFVLWETNSLQFPRSRSQVRFWTGFGDSDSFWCVSPFVSKPRNHSQPLSRPRLHSKFARGRKNCLIHDPEEMLAVLSFFTFLKITLHPTTFYLVYLIIYLFFDRIFIHLVVSSFIFVENLFILIENLFSSDSCVKV